MSQKSWYVYKFMLNALESLDKDNFLVKLLLN